MRLNITKQEFIDMYNSCTYIELQEKLNTTPNTIAKIAKSLGLSKPKGRRKEGIIFKEG